MGSVNERLQQAIAAARAGNHDQARSLAAQVLEEEPDSTNALLLLSAIAESRNEQIGYLNRILVVDPEHEFAQRQLTELKAAEDEEAGQAVEAAEGMGAEAIAADDLEGAPPEEAPVQTDVQEAQLADTVVAPIPPAEESAAVSEVAEAEWMPT